MKRFRSRYIRRVLVPMMAATLLSACHTWKVQELTPSRVVAEKQPGKIRLTMLNGDKILLADPTVSEGEIVGHPVRNASGTYQVIKSDTLHVPTDSVARIDIGEINALTTTALVAALGFLIASAIALAVGPEWDWGGG